MRVVAFTKYHREAASTRQRFLQFVPHLAAAGIELDHQPLLDNDYVRSLRTGERWSRIAVMRSYARRLGALLRKPQADLLWVYAELFPYLPAGFERLAFRAGVPVIYDCDDAFFLSYNASSNPILRALLAGKVEKLMARSAAVTCGNQYLRDYAANLCPDSRIFPTVVDTDIYRPIEKVNAAVPTIGWIGSPSTWPNVHPILPVLRALCADGLARFRVVGAGHDAVRDQFEGMELVGWSEATEVAEVQGFEIGIMPLLDEPFQRGKSGFKLIQYMACGVPAVGSPVGVNSSILGHGGGILANSPEEWDDALRRLLGDPEERRAMGERGRKEAVARFSLKSQAPRLIELFRAVATGDCSGRPLQAS